MSDGDEGGPRILTATGSYLMGIFTGAGSAVLLFLRALVTVRLIIRTLRQLIRQIDSAGIGSVLVLSLIAGLTGAIMVMQMGHTMEQYGALDTIGGMLGVTFTRELGPIWAAVIILARVGSAMAAEIGTMAVNEEVEALRVMNINPIRYLVMPRIVALILIMPVLTTIANVVGLSGGAFVANATFKVPYETFAESAKDFITATDFYGGLIKSTVFGAIIATIACSQGLRTKGGAEGVGHSTTNTVRLCVIFVLIADLVMTQLLRMFLGEGFGA